MLGLQDVEGEARRDVDGLQGVAHNGVPYRAVLAHKHQNDAPGLVQAAAFGHPAPACRRFDLQQVTSADLVGGHRSAAVPASSTRAAALAPSSRTAARSSLTRRR